MDRQLASDLFSNCLAAAEALELHSPASPGIGPEEKATLAAICSSLTRIAPPEVGRLGQLKEWLEDIDGKRDHHRHISHLYALHPGQAISPDETPNLAQAASRSLDLRGNGGTGWSLAWKIAFRARLGQGDKAHRLLSRLLIRVRDRGISYGEGGGLYRNLFCAHPPFQIDGNLGVTAAIMEMLVQSQGGVIRILPALPSAWPAGELHGARVRGNAKISLRWKGETLSHLLLEPASSRTFHLRYGSLSRSIETRAGKPVCLDGKLEATDIGAFDPSLAPAERHSRLSLLRAERLEL
jgi:alpha-L-fucosidase 2